ncbi:A/G-specific adenine glycosylase [Mumia zhuanghuii]|uniref:Adenine DNA glycosylase n=1 Tax=Mumia zhuanghuii TaxID=2585211 RepID=A0A5C4MEB6_9ACTN|nr:A/G-specific adenine glycosylase [Mumia zhuanghuii]TNC30462.1 A/G-specific adenine glycosylase [Mumia zhuanghuii]TNC49232.1 A/G-specific adenine glycosylase [Mumia zhuanghuii]
MVASSSSLNAAVVDWYALHARALPWRRDSTTAWHVLVSEVMLQQTPVERVTPVYEEWTSRWPTPSALAAEPSGEAVRAWGRLGYPRRALRLHAAATAIRDRHDGVVPEDVDELRALPGVGEYTAAAVAVFAYGHRHAVLDTNVRRVLARVFDGTALPAPGLTAAERAQALGVLPDDRSTAARWSIGVMELGALVCTARSPRCGVCPVREWCRWYDAGRPAYDGPLRRTQTYAGTDRQCRGRLLAVLREVEGPVGGEVLRAVWEDATQRERALDGLLDDRLVALVGDDLYALPD